MPSTHDLGCPPVSEDPMAPYKLTNFIVIMIVSVIGLMGNLLTILTFHRQKRKTSATMFLKYLAVFDTLLIVATNLFAHRYAYTIVFPAKWVNHIVSGKLTIGTLPFSYTFQTLSTWTIVAVAVDRYINVCHPLKATKWCKISIANKIIVGIIVAGAAYNIPRFVEYYKILEVADQAIDPCSGYFMTPEGTLGNNMAYQLSYAFVMYMGVMYVLPLVSLVFFNANIIKKMKTMVVPGADGKVAKLKGSDKLLPSLIAVMTVFFLCQIPDMVLQILWRENSPKAPTFSIIAYDFIILNSSINFIIYVVAANGFRKSLIVHVLPFLKRYTYSDDNTTSYVPSQTQKKIHSLSKPSNPHLSECSKSNSVENTWKQSYTNPNPVEEDSQPKSDEMPEHTAVTSLTSADIWIGGERSPFTSIDYGAIEGAPALTILPDGSDLGVTGAYVISQDPLLSSVRM